tara:strand:+ start:964 stop:1251 length:288 start_codon:yes stop_codon:yes gene_type:complete
MSDQLKINDAVDFIDFINSKPDLETLFKDSFPVAHNNMSAMRQSLNKRPCSCGGVNPDAVLAQRKANLQNFYVEWFQKNSEEEKELVNKIVSDYE